MKMWELKTTLAYAAQHRWASCERKRETYGRRDGFSLLWNMRLFLVVALVPLLGDLAPTAEPRPVPWSESEQKFRGELAKIVRMLEKEDAAAVAGVDGWLFLAAELKLLSLDCFSGNKASGTGDEPESALAGSIPAILDFQTQLKERGIDLVIVPVPPKAAIYPEKILPGSAVQGDGVPVLRYFYAQLRGLGIQVLDLAPLFAQERESSSRLFCKTDTHWSGTGCVLAARAIAEDIRAKLPTGPVQKHYTSEWKAASIHGDLVTLLPANAQKPGPESVSLRIVRESATGASVEPDPESPLLLLGDSHTLVFHDLLAQRAGLLDQLALELGFAPDLIGTLGSGATPVRITLYRRSAKDPNFLKKKRVVVWCFTAREFAAPAEEWPKLPISK
jgi:hypothetical protein